jgi:hypothetical protein
MEGMIKVNKIFVGKPEGNYFEEFGVAGRITLNRILQK